MGKFVLKQNRGKFSFNLCASNGRTILTSQLYSSKQSANNGIKSVKTSSKSAGRFDKRTAKNGAPYFVLTARNGEIIGKSEMYSGHGARNAGIASVQRNAPGAKIEDLT